MTGESGNASMCPEWVPQRDTIKRAPVDADWLAQRAPFVGASQAAALFGDHPFLTLADLARQHRTQERQPDNAAMARGRHLEDGIARWWAEVHGVEVREATDLYMVDGVLIATLDRIVEHAPPQGMGRVALEVKTTATRVHDVERYWWWQAQAQLACTGFDRIEFAVLDASMRLQSFTVEPEPTAMRNLVDAARAFLDRVNDPTVNLDDIAHTPPDAVELDAEGRSLLRAWRFAQQRLDEMTRDVQTIKGILDRTLGACDSGTVNGNEVVRRYHRKGQRTIDGTRLRADHPDIANAYTNVGQPSHYLVLK
jgi:YqaJ-like viral recombinase domain